MIFLGSDAESTNGENNTKVQFRPQKTNKIYYTWFYRHAFEQLGQGNSIVK